MIIIQVRLPIMHRQVPKSKTPQMYENNSSNLYQDYEFFLNYDRTLDRHHIAVMLGIQMNYVKIAP